MFSPQKVEGDIRSLYYYGMDAAGYSRASVESMLDKLNFYAIAQAVQHNSAPVYSSAVDSPMFRQRGRELFGQRAALLYTDSVISDTPVTASYSDCAIPDKAVMILYADCFPMDDAAVTAMNAIRKSFLYRISVGCAYELWMLE